MRNSLLSLPKVGLRRREPVYDRERGLYLFDPQRPQVGGIYDDEFEGSSLNPKWVVNTTGSPTWSYNTPKSPSCVRFVCTAASQIINIVEPFQAPAGTAFSISTGLCYSAATTGGGALIGLLVMSGTDFVRVWARFINTNYIQINCDKTVSGSYTPDMGSQSGQRQGRIELRLERNTSNTFKFMWSYDRGASWSTVFTQTFTFGTIDSIKVQLDMNSEVFASVAAIDYVRVGWQGLSTT